MTTSSSSWVPASRRWSAASRARWCSCCAMPGTPAMRACSSTRCRLSAGPFDSLGNPPKGAPMCPLCFSAATLAVAGVVPAGALSALAWRLLRVPAHPPAEPTEAPMDYPRVVSREEWLAARKRLLAREKSFTHQRDELAAARRALPMMKIEKDYVFEDSAAPARLPDLFEGR